jgi:peptidoglycan/xylan/chitin deacetylase (PgdA/CDA1 family)
MVGGDHLREAASYGIEIGAHSRTHRPLDLVPRRELEWEIAGSRADLEHLVDRPIRTFAYPHGWYTRRVQSAVRRAGFDAACAVKNALSPPDDDVLALNRVTIKGGTSARTVLDVVQGREVPVGSPRPRPHTTMWRAVRRARHLAQSVLQR